MMSSSVPLIACSDGVNPSVSALVESDMSSSTPLSPNARSLSTSINLPSTGCWSNVKSVTWTTVPAGVCTTMPTASGMLWQMWKNSTVKQPRVQPVFLGDGVQLAVGRQPSFFQLELGQPAVSAVA